MRIYKAGSSGHDPDLETIDIPEDNEMYAEGKRQVKVYWFEL